MTTRRNQETQLDPLASAPDSKQQLLDQLADEFVSLLRAGNRPSIAEFQQRHPTIKEEIEEVLTSVAMIEDLKQQNDTVGRVSKRPFEDLSFERIGDYKIIRELGRGGMGIVYAAVHESLGRKVAIKVLPSKVFEGTEALARFKKEAQAAAKLHHSNIVNVFGVGECEGFHYYVMEYVSGQTLAHVIDRLKSESGTDPVDQVALSEKDTLPLAIPHFETTADRCVWSAERIARIADALEYSHVNQILHRDIKPGNILIDDQQKPWITDFGLVKELANQSMTRTGDLFGTPQYMAPEAFEGFYDQRSEVYCLGLTLYELLARQPAYCDSSPTKLFKMIATTTPKSLRQIDSRIPSDLETIVNKSIERDPAKRYQTAGEFRDDLERFAEDLPIHARRVLPVERAIRWSRRNPLLAFLAGLSAALLFLVASISARAYFVTDQALTELRKKHTALTEQEAKTRAAVELANENAEKSQAEFLRAEANVALSMKAFDELFKRIMTKGVGRDLKEDLELETFSELSSLESSVTKEDAQILQGAIQFYEKFTEQNQGNEGLTLEIAKAYRRIANTYHLIGEFGSAQRGYQKAAKVFEKIVEKDPHDFTSVLNLAETYNELALAYRKQNRLPAGIKEHQKARRLLENDLYKTNKQCQYALANTLNRLCTFSSGMSQSQIRFRPRKFFEPDRNLAKSIGEFVRIVPQRAAFLHQAQTISEELLKQDPENPDYRLLRAKLFRTNATVLGVGGQRSVELNRLKESIAELEKLVKDYPENPSFKYTLAHTQMIRFRSIPITIQIEMTRSAEEIAEELVTDYPSVLEYRDLHATVTQKLGRLCLMGNQPDNALTHFEKAKSSLKKLIEKMPYILTYYFQYASVCEQLADLHLQNNSKLKAKAELQGLIMFLQSARPLNRMRPKKNEMLESARNKLRQMRFE